MINGDDRSPIARPVRREVPARLYDVAVDRYRRGSVRCGCAELPPECTCVHNRDVAADGVTVPPKVTFAVWAGQFHTTLKKF